MGKTAQNMGLILFIAGLLLFCYGFGGSLFWYANPGAKPVIIADTIYLVPGGLEKPAGIVLAVAGVFLMLKRSSDRRR